MSRDFIDTGTRARRSYLASGFEGGFQLWPVAPVILPPPLALYQRAVADAADQVRHGWTGWPSRSYSLARHSVREQFEQTKPHWERDRLRVWEYRATDDGVPILFSTTPDIDPSSWPNERQVGWAHPYSYSAARYSYSKDR